MKMSKVLVRSAVAKHARYAVLPIVGSVAAACAADPTAPAADGQGSLAVNVAPMSIPEGFPSVSEVVYSIIVRDSNGNIVFDENQISTNQFGNSDGSLAYVGTCNAVDENDDNNQGTSDAALNTVELVIDGVKVNGGVPLEEGVDFKNPCPAPGFGEKLAACNQKLLCVENDDTKVEFNVAIMRDANQGFFDIAISFTDLFCSAKLDCQEEFLSADVDGSGNSFSFEPARTEVLGFACATGEGKDTFLYMSEINLDCGSAGQWRYRASAPEGTQLSGTGLEPGPVAQWSVFRETEDVRPYHKGFWNFAVVLKAGQECTITAQATASSEVFQEGYSPLNTRYPVVNFEVDASSTSCHPNQALDAPGSGVVTDYLPLSNNGICFTNSGFVPPLGPNGADAPIQVGTTICADDCVTCDNDVITATKQFGEIVRKQAETQRALDAAETRVSDLTAAHNLFVQQYNDFNAAQQAEKARLETLIASLNQQIAAKEQQIADNQANFNISTQEREANDARLKAERASLENAKADAVADLAATNATIADAEAEAAIEETRYQEQLAAFNNSVNQIQTKVDNYSAELAILGGDINATQEACASTCVAGTLVQSAQPAPQ